MEFEDYYEISEEESQKTDGGASGYMIRGESIYKNAGSNNIINVNVSSMYGKLIQKPAIVGKTIPCNVGLVWNSGGRITVMRKNVHAKGRIRFMVRGQKGNQKYGGIVEFRWVG